MEYLIFVVIISLVFIVYDKLVTNTPSLYSKSSLQKDKNSSDIEIITKNSENKSYNTKEEKIVNNFYVQNNSYTYNNNRSSLNGKGGHTYDKWQQLGYQVKSSEHYSYKHYGHEIFLEDQVVKLSDSLPLIDTYSKPKKTYKKARTSELHTYSEWMDLGYQVRKGQRKIKGNGSNALFSRNQVAMI